MMGAMNDRSNDREIAIEAACGKKPPYDTNGKFEAIEGGRSMKPLAKRLDFSASLASPNRICQKPFAGIREASRCFGF